MIKYIIGSLLLLGAAAFGTWYWLRRKALAKEVRFANPGASPEQVETLTEEAFGRYLDGVRQHLSGASRVQFDRLVTQVKDLAAKAQAKVKAAADAVIPAKTEGDEPTKA